MRQSTKSAGNIVLSLLFGGVGEHHFGVTHFHKFTQMEHGSTLGNPGCLFQIRNGVRNRGLPLRVIHPVQLLAELME